MVSIVTACGGQEDHLTILTHRAGLIWHIRLIREVKLLRLRACEKSRLDL